ncbi:hypothetical protein B0H10DRAFT_1957956 [Mycena sp. CBHHK59/15]|nr:hypothetical protein B0H10DRAFT_1957956 [Mycena sp. CBHHK59/15]
MEHHLIVYILCRCLAIKLKTLLELRVSNRNEKKLKITIQLTASELVLALLQTHQAPVQRSRASFERNHTCQLAAAILSGFPALTISRFNGPVTYSAEGFLERNLDVLNLDFVGLMSGGGGGSNNPFVKGLFSGRAPAQRGHDLRRAAARQSDARAVDAPQGRVLGDCGGGGRVLSGAGHAASSRRSTRLRRGTSRGGASRQARNVGLAQVARRNASVFEVGMTFDEFCERYREGMEAGGVTEGSKSERVEQARTAFGLGEKDVVLGVHKVYPSQVVFHRFEDQLRVSDVEEQKRNRVRDAEIEGESEPWGGGYGDAYNTSTQALPLVANASPFQCADLFEPDTDTDYDENKSLRAPNSDIALHTVLIFLILIIT